MFSYSKEFRRLLKNKNTVKTLIEGSKVHGANFKKWEEMRSFIAKAINKGGKILDIGCANGFFLRCLQEWSNFKLDPYGIDVDEKLIKEARELFPDVKSNFVKLDLKEVDLLSKYGLPLNFDFIYWNVWDNWKFETPDQVNLIDSLLAILNEGGRLILGFYDSKKRNNLDRVRKLASLGYKIDGEIKNTQSIEMIIWFKS